MRICYLADASSIHTQKWVSYFAECGYDVHVISFDKTPIANVTCHTLPLPTFIETARKHSRALKIVMFPLKLLITLFTLRQLIKQIHPDILHAHYITNYGFFSALTGFQPLVVTAWGSDIINKMQNRLLGLARSFMARIVLAKSRLVTSDGENVTNQMIQLGCSPNKIKHVNFGVDTSKFKPQPKSKRDSTVISTRRFEPIYNVETLIEAIPTVTQKIPAANFIIVGKGSQEKQLKHRAKQLGITSHIQFITAVENDHMPHLLNAADIYVSTSLSDAGIAASTAEAMSCELPVVITDNGDNAMWVQHHINGCVIPNSDSVMLAKELLFLLESPLACWEYGKNNRAIIVEKNNYFVEMAKMKQLYEKMIKWEP